MSGLKVSIYGLNELESILNPARLNHRLASKLDELVLGVHSTLRSKIERNYTFRSSLDNYRVNKSSSSVSRARGYLLNGLEYVDKAKPDLSKFTYRFDPGSEENPTARKHYVKVRRNNERALHRKGFGGFVPRSKAGKATLIEYNGRPQTLMIERLTKKRYPLRTLYGPSIIQIARGMLDKDPDVKRAIDKAELGIIDLL